MDGLCFPDIRILYLCVVLISLMTEAQYYHNRLHHPHFNQSKRNVTYHVGQTAVLECSVKDLGTKQVIWKNVRNNNVLTVGEDLFAASGSYSINHPDDSQNWNLVIKDVQKRHAGAYECQVSTKEEMYIIVHLNVIDPPPPKNNSAIETPTTKKRPAVVLSGPEFVEKDKPIVISCNATGALHAPEDVDWFFNGQKIQSSISDDILITKFTSPETKTLYSNLEIKRSKMDDTGTYICRSSDLEIESHALMVLNAWSNNTKRDKKTDLPKDGVRDPLEQSGNGCSSLHHLNFDLTFLSFSFFTLNIIYLPR